MQTLDDPAASRETWWLPRVWAGFLTLLIVATWRLWVPQADYPAIPMIGLDEQLQRWLSDAALVGIAVGAVAAMLARGARLGWLLISASLAIAFLVDQQRLQPWAYQACVVGLIFATLPYRSARRWLITLTASVYVYSALGKFDYQFVHTVGQDFLQPVWDATGLGGRLDESQRAVAALLLPTVELIGGVGVLIPRTRRAAGIIVVMMHVGLFLLLGPLGQQHSLGVLLWNLLLAVAAWELFVRRPREGAGDTSPASAANAPPRRHLGAVLAKGVAMAALVAPLGERAGYWDHWPSWALYSPHNSRVKVQVHRSVIDRLPEALRPADPSAEPFSAWIDVDLDRWSLRARGAPIYPQARYQLALATAVAETPGLENAVRCIEQGVADRWTGRREERMAIGATEMRRLLDRYWLNPRPSP